MSARSAARSPGPQRPRSVAVVWRALSAAVREEFGQALKDVVLREGVQVVGLWWGRWRWAAVAVRGRCGRLRPGRFMRTRFRSRGGGTAPCGECVPGHVQRWGPRRCRPEW